MNLLVKTNRVRGVAFCSVLLTAAAFLSATAAPMAQARGVFTTYGMRKNLSFRRVGRDLEPRNIGSGIKHDVRTVDATLRRTLDLRHRL